MEATRSVPGMRPIFELVRLEVAASSQRTIERKVPGLATRMHTVQQELDLSLETGPQSSSLGTGVPARGVSLT